MSKATWSNEQTGEQLCVKHAGSYLTAAIKAEPKAISHWTPLGVWVKLQPGDHQMWRTMFGHDCLCESCVAPSKQPRFS